MSLDPKTNREAREAKKTAAEVPPPLEPAFPFSRVNFDPFFFGVTVVLTARPVGSR